MSGQAINDAIRTKAPGFETSIGSGFVDAVARLALLILTVGAAGVTGFGLYRLVRPPTTDES